MICPILHRYERNYGIYRGHEFDIFITDDYRCNKNYRPKYSGCTVAISFMSECEHTEQTCDKYVLIKYIIINAENALVKKDISLYLGDMLSDLKTLISNHSDFPKPGVLFREISPLLFDVAARKEIMEAF